MCVCVVDDSVSTVILYGDGCCYQNCNVTLSNALIHFAVSRRKTIFQKFLEKGPTGYVHCNWIWRQTQGVPDILASRVHWCNNCCKKGPYLWSQTSGPHFLQRLLQAEFLSSIRPGSSAGDPQVVDLWCLQYLLDGSVSYKISYTDQWRPLPQRRRKNKADDSTITRMYITSPMRITSPSGSIFSSWRKYCPKTTITFMMHCLMETGYWKQELRQFWFQGRHPWTSKEHAQQSKN